MRAILLAISSLALFVGCSGGDADDDADDDVGALEKVAAESSTVTKRYVGSFALDGAVQRVTLEVGLSTSREAVATVKNRHDSQSVFGSWSPSCEVRIASAVALNIALAVRAADGSTLIERKRSASFEPGAVVERGELSDAECTRRAAANASRAPLRIERLAGFRPDGAIDSAWVEGAAVTVNATTVDIASAPEFDGMGPQTRGPSGFDSGVGLSLVANGPGTTKAGAFEVRGRLEVTWPERIELGIGIGPSGDPDRGELVYAKREVLRLEPDAS